MKFLRIICNVLLFFVLSVVLCLIQVGTYDIIASQDNKGLRKETSIEIVNVVPSDDKVSFTDTFTFWGTDIATGVASAEPKYRIRSWGDYGWASKMKWADKALDVTIAVFKPIFVPIAQVNAVKDYYLEGEYTINEVYKQTDVTNEQLYEMYTIFESKSFNDENKLVLPEDFVYAGSSTIKIENEKYVIDGLKFDSIEALGSSDEAYFKWVKKNKDAFNTDWKLKKYNMISKTGEKVYGKYARRFVFGLDTTTRVVKSSIVVLYYIQLVSVILALIFVIKYPVALLQYRWTDARKRRKERKGLEG